MAKYFLTDPAALDLVEIYRRSVGQWGERVADRYLADLYDGFAVIASRPESGEARRMRSYPFLMLPVRKHFVVYDRISEGVIIVTVTHQMRDVEAVLAALAPNLAQEIAALKAALAGR
jgi:toxin ParE1/3/4